MLVKNIITSIEDRDFSDYKIDYLPLEWYELNKRVQRKVTSLSTDISLKFLSESVMLKQGDVLHIDQETKTAIVVSVLSCEIIVLSPQTMLEMATICYEIGNKHMPLFINNNELLLPFEAPMYKWLQSAGYSPKKEEGKLVNRLKSGVSDHQHLMEENHSDSLFTKVINFAAKKSK